MGLAHGGDIVSDGLVLCLDAANVRSYPKSGTVWSDLSGNGNNGTLTNGPTFSSDNGGSIVFDGVNDYVNCVNNSSINPISSISVSSFFNISSYNSNYAPIVFKQNNYSGNYEQYSLYLTNSATGFVVTGIDRVQKVANSLFDYRNKTVYVVGTCDTNMDELNLYINGALVSTTSFTSSFDISTNPLKLGTAVSSYPGWAIGKIYNVSIYSKALSESEIKQNYLATKGRFGL